jgi:hypothetical protein
MNQNIDIKSIWQKNKAELPDLTEIYERIQRFNRERIRALVITNIILVLTASFIIFVWLYYQPQYSTTKLGIAIIIFAIIMNLILSNRLLPLFMKVHQEQNNSQYLKGLLKIKEKQKFLLHVVLKLYYVFLVFGLTLYLYEYTSRMSTWGSVLTYGVIYGWILIAWFYFRPKSVKKQEQKLDELILRLTRIEEQFMEEK